MGKEETFEYVCQSCGHNFGSRRPVSDCCEDADVQTVHARSSHRHKQRPLASHLPGYDRAQEIFEEAEEESDILERDRALGTPGVVRAIRWAGRRIRR